MASGVTVKGQMEYLLAMRRVRQAMVDKKMLDALAKLIISRIRKRTYSGIDANGKPAKRKKDGSIRRLWKTGKLLKSPKYKISGSTITIYVPTYGKLAIIAEVHNYGMIAGRGKGFKMPQYYWFDLSKNDRRVIAKYQEMRFTRLMRSALTHT